jgi:uncharacterized protein (DUF1015 family)
MHIIPFKALRPQPQLAPKVASKPYDVLNSMEAKIEAENNPNSFLHITKAEIDLPAKTDIHSTIVYQQARENLRAFIQRGVLFRETKPCYYIYELVMNSRSQTGLVCGSSIDDYENDLVKKHEFTRPEKEQDRINHIQTTLAQTGNVFLTYRNVEVIDNLIQAWKEKNNPVYDFTTEDGVHHTVWTINKSEVIEKITELFESNVPCTYIADGHHRAASAAKVRKALINKKTESSNFFLTTLFPSNQLHIMDYNRLVKDLNGHDETEFMKLIYEDFDVEKMPSQLSPTHPHEFGMYLGGTWYKLTAKEGTYSDDPIGILDVTILQNNLLDKILGIQDQRTDKRIDFVGGIRGLVELENRVNSGEMKVAFSLHPVTIDQLFNIADSGNVMPPKSTWFEPKLRDGLLTYLIE